MNAYTIVYTCTVQRVESFNQRISAPGRVIEMTLVVTATAAVNTRNPTTCTDTHTHHTHTHHTSHITHTHTSHTHTHITHITHTHTQSRTGMHTHDIHVQ